MLLMHEERGCKSQTFPLFPLNRSISVELWDCGCMPPHSSTSDSWWDLILCFDSSGLSFANTRRVQQDLFPPLHLFRMSPLKSFHPLYFLNLTESFSFTSLRKIRLRSSLASWTIRVTIWPAAPITIFYRYKKYNQISHQWIDGTTAFILLQSHLTNAGLQDMNLNLKGACGKKVHDIWRYNSRAY